MTQQFPSDPQHPGQPQPGPYGPPPGQPQERMFGTPPPAPKKKRRWLVPTIISVVAFFLGVMVGVGGEDEPAEVAAPEPAPTVTVTAEAEPVEAETVEVEVPGPTVTVTEEPVAAAEDVDADVDDFVDSPEFFVTVLQATWAGLPAEDQEVSCSLGPEFAATMLEDYWTNDSPYYVDEATEFFQSVC